MLINDVIYVVNYECRRLQFKTNVINIHNGCRESKFLKCVTKPYRKF